MSSHHPVENILALYAGGDLDWADRLRVAFHVRGCGECERQVADLKAIRTSLAAGHSDPIPDWDRLSDEMTANIRLGISMAECVGPARREPKFSLAGLFSKPAVLAAAGGLAVLAGGFMLNMPLDRISRLWHLTDHSGLVLQSTDAGIEMRRDGQAVITVRHPNRKTHEVSANLGGSMSAGYVDDETGQVTIINVAGQ